MAKAEHEITIRLDSRIQELITALTALDSTLPEKSESQDAFQQVCGVIRAMTQSGLASQPILPPATAWARDTGAFLDFAIKYRRQAAQARQDRLITPQHANRIDDAVETIRAILGDGAGLTVTAPVSHTRIASCGYCGDRHEPHCVYVAGDKL